MELVLLIFAVVKWLRYETTLLWILENLAVQVCFIHPYTTSRPTGVEREGGRARSARQLRGSETVAGIEASSQSRTGSRDDFRGGNGKPVKAAPEMLLQPCGTCVQLLCVASLFGDYHHRRRRGRAILQRDVQATQSVFTAVLASRCSLVVSMAIFQTLYGPILQLLGGRIRWRLCCLPGLDVVTAILTRKTPHLL